jgi:polar amino acid transport system permease protein
MEWTWEIFWNIFQGFIPAALMTLRVTVLGILVGMVLGIFFALIRLAKNPVINAPAKLYIYVIRGTPLLLQLLLLYFGLTFIVKLDRIPSAIIALGIHNGAYIAEIFRGAIQSVDRGQREAGISLGMTGAQVMRRIILPQAFKNAIPPLGNQFIIALKDSSLASAVAVPELLLHARQTASANAMSMEMLSIAAVFYLFMTSLLTLGTNRIERRLRVSEHRS